MMEVFFKALAVNSAFNGDISKWNTEKVTDMGYMFYKAYAFNQDIGSWNTAQVTRIDGMFAEASAFNQDIGSWNTGKVTTMYGMFYSRFCVQPRHWELEHSASDFYEIMFY